MPKRSPLSNKKPPAQTKTMEKWRNPKPLKGERCFCGARAQRVMRLRGSSRYRGLCLECSDEMDNARDQQINQKIRTDSLFIAQLLNNRKRRGRRAYAIATLMIELSNELGVNVDHPGLVATFFRIAAFRGQDSENPAVKTALRHLDVLLEKPSKREVDKIIEFWDSGEAFYLRADPFDSNAAELEQEAQRQRRELQQRRDAEYERDGQILALRQQLDALKRLPENEAERFRLETEIYKREQEKGSDEWPDVIAA